MYSYSKLPASLNQQESLSGILDIFGMRSYWNALKTKLTALRELGATITQHWAKISYAQRNLLARGETAKANMMGDELKKIADDLQKWAKVKQYIDTYLPEWMQLDEGIKVAPTSGVSGAPLVLGAFALTALAYCVNTGLALLQDYQYKMQLTQAVIDQKLSTGQVTDLLSVPRSEGLLEKAVSTVGLGAAIGIPTVLIVGGGLYVLMATGMLKGVMGSVSGMLGGTTSKSEV